jgi:hypothetical protein
MTANGNAGPSCFDPRSVTIHIAAAAALPYPRARQPESSKAPGILPGAFFVSHLSRRFSLLMPSLLTARRRLCGLYRLCRLFVAGRSCRAGAKSRI